MVHCAGCAQTLDEGTRFCPGCGGPVDGAVTTTRGAAGGRSASTATGGRRFVPGTVLAKRYRIVGRIGAGGSGEVYRADDLRLGQPVALKFLLASVQNDPERIARLHHEARLAREITHPAVCRVHDIGEVDGLHFLTMEYVDGEDLASLLRRIGRLPVDKALEIARELCAGLAAAHDRNVLHRDLKPHNVMLDGRGQVRVTDFGVASVLGTPAAGTVSGTPAYMAPELLDGREATVQSDLYALGLTLYELFTGRRAFDALTWEALRQQQRQTVPARPSSLVPEVDPLVDSVVMHCLERDPARRPASVRAVASLLPGSDQIAAAVATGVTPSPELLVAAERQPAVPLRGIWVSLLLVAAGTWAAVFGSQRSSLLPDPSTDKPPGVLEARAREMLGRFGRQGLAVDHAAGLDVDIEHFRYQAEEGAAPAVHRQPLLQYWYRESPQPLVHRGTDEWLRWTEPPSVLPGMAGIRLDAEGRLLEFYAVPAERQLEPATVEPAPDWSPALLEAGLDPHTLTPVTPQWAPPFHADLRLAWEGRDPRRPDVRLRVEAASQKGRPVYFRVVAPWMRPERVEPFQWTAARAAAEMTVLILFLAMLAMGAILARRNLRSGRADRTGARRLSVYVMMVWLLAWPLSAHHVWHLTLELALITEALKTALYTAAMTWILYLAIEPYVRRLWPHALVSWTRLLRASLSDPVVGRDVLFGVALGAAVAALEELRFALPVWLGLPRSEPTWSVLYALIGWRRLATTVVGAQIPCIVAGMCVVLLLVVLRSLTRRQWAAAALLTIALGASHAFSVSVSDPLWIRLPLGIAMMGAAIMAVVRFGLLTGIVGIYVATLLAPFPLTTDLTAWHSGPTLFVVSVVGAMTAWSARAALAGRELFPDLRVP